MVHDPCHVAQKKTRKFWTNERIRILPQIYQSFWNHWQKNDTEKNQQKELSKNYYPTKFEMWIENFGINRAEKQNMKYELLTNGP